MSYYEIIDLFICNIIRASGATEITQTESSALSISYHVSFNEEVTIVIYRPLLFKHARSELAFLAVRCAFFEELVTKVIMLTFVANITVRNITFLKFTYHAHLLHSISSNLRTCSAAYPIILAFASSLEI
jgi:hypothetical protein